MAFQHLLLTKQLRTFLMGMVFENEIFGSTWISLSVTIAFENTVAKGYWVE